MIPGHPPIGFARFYLVSVDPLLSSAAIAGRLFAKFRVRLSYLDRLRLAAFVGQDLSWQPVRMRFVARTGPGLRLRVRLMV